MEKMTCKQLGGACDQTFESMTAMMELMKSPEAMTKWFDDKRKEFEAL